MKDDELKKWCEDFLAPTSPEDLKKLRDALEKEAIDLHPSDYIKDWKPPIGNQLYRNEKPHIWQEFKRDLTMTRKPGQPLIGPGWPILVFVFLGGLIEYWMAVSGGPSWVLAARSLF